MLWALWNGNSVPPRVRSKGARPGRKLGFVPEVVQGGASVGSTQGGLNVGSVIPKWNCSNSRVCLRSTPNLRLWRPENIDRSLLITQLSKWRFLLCLAGGSSNGLGLGKYSS